MTELLEVSINDNVVVGNIAFWYFTVDEKRVLLRHI